MKCSKCHKNLFENKNNKIKLRTNILIFEKSENGKEYKEALIKCPFCKTENYVPILLDTSKQTIQHLIFD